MKLIQSVMVKPEVSRIADSRPACGSWTRRDQIFSARARIMVRNGFRWNRIKARAVSAKSAGSPGQRASSPLSLVWPFPAAEKPSEMRGHIDPGGASLDAPPRFAPPPGSTPYPASGVPTGTLPELHRAATGSDPRQPTLRGGHLPSRDGSGRRRISAPAGRGTNPPGVHRQGWRRSPGPWRDRQLIRNNNPSTSERCTNPATVAPSRTGKTRCG